MGRKLSIEEKLITELEFRELCEPVKTDALSKKTLELLEKDIKVPEKKPEPKYTKGQLKYVMDLLKDFQVPPECYATVPERIHTYHQLLCWKDSLVLKKN